MKVVDFSVYIVVYNFIIGILLMIASEKLGVYAGHLVTSYTVRAARLTRLVTFTFGACLAILSAGIYFAFNVLKL